MDFYFKALIFTSVCNLFAIWRLFANRIQRNLKVLLVFLLFQFAETVALIVVTSTPQSRAYEKIYETTEPLNWIFYILIVREMYNLVFAGYPGISSLARWATYASAIASAALCVVMGSNPTFKNTDHAQIFGYIAFWERCLSISLGVFIVLMIFLLARYPIGIDFNVAASISIFTVYFTGIFALLAIGSLETSIALGLQTYGLFALSSICYISWGLLLTKSSARQKVRVRPHIDAYEEKRLLDQLDLINNMLVKSARN